MRAQALLKPAFMREWAKSNKITKEQFQLEYQQWHRRSSRIRGRREKKQMVLRAANIRYLQENQELIESGRHLNSLLHFSALFLMEPDKIESECGNKKLFIMLFRIVWILFHHIFLGWVN